MKAKSEHALRDLHNTLDCFCQRTPDQQWAMAIAEALGTDPEAMGRTPSMAVSALASLVAERDALRERVAELEAALALAAAWMARSNPFENDEPHSHAAWERDRARFATLSKAEVRP